jgi:mono/diheme cytochrome c family protein
LNWLAVTSHGETACRQKGTRNVKTLLIATALTIAASVAYANGAADPVAQGKQIVETKKCSLCHAIDGVGGKKDIPALNGILKDKADDAVAKVLAGEEKGPSGKMHPMKVKTPEEQKAVIEYLKTLK